MALVHTIVNIGLPVLMAPILKPFNKVLSYGYLSAGITATVIIIIGSIGNFYAYQIGMAIWGFGGLMFCYLLYISKLVPRGLSVWGFVGYIVFIAGTISELFGYPIGVQLAIPGGLFEITLSIWLIIKGFRASELRS